MLELSYVQGKNIVTYPEFFVDLSTPGLTIVRGQNRAGKSLLFSSIANVLYFSPPLERQSNKAKNLHTKGSEIRVGIKKHDQQFHIEQASKGKSVGYKIYQHHEDEDFDKNKHDIHKRHDVKDKIREIFPQPAELFYSITYINSYRQHSLQKGSSAERHEFFKQVFNLDIFDSIRTQLSAYNKELRENKSTLDYVRNEYDKLSPNQVDIKKIKSKLDDLKSRYKKLEKGVEQYQDELQQLNAYCTLADSLNYPDTDLNNLKKQRKKLKNQLDEKKQYKQKLDKQIAEAEANKKNLERKQKIESKLEQFDKKYKEKDRTSTQKKLDELDKKLDDLNDQYEDAKKDKAKQEEIDNKWQKVDKDQIKKLIDLDTGQETIQQKIAEIQSEQKLDKKTVSELDSEHYQNCPTCRRKLNEQTRQQIVQGAKKRLKKAKQNQRQLELVYEIKRLEADLSGTDFEEIEKQISKLKKDRSKLENKQKKIEAYLSLQEKYNNLPDLGTTKMPKDDPKQLSKDIDKLQSKINKIDSDIKTQNKLNDLGIEQELSEARSHKDEIQKYVDTYRPKMKSLNNKIQKLVAKYENGKQTNKQLKQLSQSIAEYEEKIQDQEIYEALLDAYGARGLRIWQVQHLAKQLEHNLNKFSNLIFVEPIRFEINVGKTNFDILAERNNGKISDVSMLSGSESQCFKMLCVLSLIPLIPKHLRTNLVVLDEIENGLDEKSRRLFASDFLIKLQEIIPRVILVTPVSQKELYVDGAQEIYIRKDSGKSRVVDQSR